MNWGRASIVCLLAFLAFACKPQQAATPTSGAAATDGAVASAQSDGSNPGARTDTCPVRVPATTVTVLNTKDGVAMYFTTLGSNVDEVRRRSKALADSTSPAPSAAPAADRLRVDVPPWEVLGHAGVVPLRVTEEDIPEGARLVLVPVDASDLDELRSYARAQGERMRLGDCPAGLLRGRGHATAEASPPDSKS